MPPHLLEALFIIVDDGSTDDSFSILTEYAAKDKRIVLLLKNDKNLGIVARMDSNEKIVVVGSSVERKMKLLNTSRILTPWLILLS